jgi:hypothetical protein
VEWAASQKRLEIGHDWRGNDGELPDAIAITRFSRPDTSNLKMGNQPPKASPEAAGAYR